jgi:hypothetical protein
MIDMVAFRDEGPVISGRGTPIEVDDFNMKSSASYTIEYFPTKETTGAPLVRPVLLGEQALSFKVYTFFRLTGDTEVVKNLRFTVSVEGTGEADGVQLFYKHTNVYQEPTDAYDGDMIYLGTPGGSILQAQFWPNFSTVGPHLATSRASSYTLATGTPLYTNYFVTQLRVNKGSTVGNSCEFKLKLSCHEFL